MLFKIGSDEKPYSVHADLLCKSSAFFRKALQCNKQDAKGRCAICQYNMSPEYEELTHCADCGVNYHFSCLETWKEHAPSPVRCPVCRCEWKEISLDLHTLSDIEGPSFDLYVDWLYQEKLLFVRDELVNDRYEDLVEAYIVGKHLEDDSFCNAALHSIVESCANLDWFPESDAIQKCGGVDSR